MMSGAGTNEVCGEQIHMRRKCGCVKNIEEIKELLKRFPTVPSCKLETPATPNTSPVSRDFDECEIDSDSLMTQKTMPCDIACEKIFKDQSQWIFHGKYGGTCYTSDKGSSTPCPPQINQQWAHYGQRRPHSAVKERSCDGSKCNTQPLHPEKLEQVTRSEPSYEESFKDKYKVPTCSEPSYEERFKDKYKSYNTNCTSEKKAPCPMDGKGQPKNAKGPQSPRDRFTENLDDIKYGNIEKNRTKCVAKLMVNILQFIQLLLTCIAILIYYCIFCYMHLVYFTLKSAVYFHQADAAMKTTIAVVTVTSLVIALNVLMKFERLVGIA